MSHFKVIIALFFFSGFSGLLFEIVWCRLFLRALGAGSVANSCVFAGFMAGAAVGAIVGWKNPALLKKLGRPFKQENNSTLDHLAAAPFARAYGRLELIAALSGLAITALLNTATCEFVASILGGIGGGEGLCNALRFLICFVILLLPCSAMGAAYATIEKSFDANHSSKNFFPLLYGANTIGAALGGISAAFIFLPEFGAALTSEFAAAINILIFIAIEIFFKAGGGVNSNAKEAQANANMPEANANKPDANSDKPETATKLPKPERPVFWAACAFLSGFLALILEITWTRIFSLVLGSSAYSLATVLLMVLAGSGLGALAYGMTAQKSKWRGQLIYAAFLLAGASILASCYLQSFIFWIFVETSTYLSPLFSSDPFICAILSRIFLAFIFVFFPAFFLGAVLPLSTLNSGNTHLGSRFYALNCIGASSACLIYAQAIFPLLSEIKGDAMLSSLVLVAILSIFAAFIIKLKESFESGSTPKLGSLLIAGATFILPSVLVFKAPQWDAGLMGSGFLVYRSNSANSEQTAPKESLLKYREGINGTISVVESAQSNSISIKSDGKVEATLPVDLSVISPGSDLSTHVLLGGLPLLFHDGAAKDAMLIGLGSGVTASTLLSFPELKSLTVAELEAAVVETCKVLANFNGAPLNEQNLKSGRVSLNLNDARFVLASSPKTYDLVISQPADPWVSGSADLYTQEFWTLAAKRLNKNGVFCQWIQLYAIPQEDLARLIHTFKSVFKSVYICHAPGAGELILFGYKDGDDTAITQPDRILLPAAIRIEQSSQSALLLAAAGISDPYDALGTIICGPEQCSNIKPEKNGEVELNTDDKPKAEYATARALLTSDSKLDANMRFIEDVAAAKRAWTPTFGNKTEANSLKIRRQNSWLARAFSKQSLQDASVFSPFNKSRATDLLAASTREPSSAFEYWNKAIVLRAFGKTGESNENIEQALNCKISIDDLSRLALFDIEFERNNLSEAAKQLQSCDPQALETSDGMLRRAFLLLRQGKNRESLELFSKLCKQFPCFLPALAGNSYAALSVNDSLAAEDFMHKYLCINPWDFQSQLAYTSILCRLKVNDDALIHAKCASKLKPHNASALILVLESQLQSKDWKKATAVIKYLKEQMSDAAGVDEIRKATDDGKNPSNLLTSKDFQSIVQKLSLEAEDPKNGYMMLGEP